MNNSELHFKIFKKSFGKYILLFCCNAFVIMAQCFFLNVLFNNTFMNPTIIDPMISSNIYAPTVMSFIFAMIFIPYSHFYFYQKKEREYGIFEAVGLDIHNIISIILKENIIIAVCSTIIGIVAGLGLTAIFVSVMKYNFGLENLQIELSGKTFAVLLGFLAVIYFFVALSLCIKIYKKSTVQLIKSDRAKYEGHSPHVSVIIIGVLLCSASFYYSLFIIDQEHNDYFIPAFIVAMLGLYFIVDNMLFYINRKKRNLRRYYKNLLLYTGIAYRFDSEKKVLFTAICLISIALFFQTLSIIEPSVNKEMVKTYYPHHITYIECEGYNEISNNEMNRIISDSNITVKSHETVNYIVSDGVGIISKNDAEYLTKQKYEVHARTGILLQQYESKDGYQHDKNMGPNVVNISTKGKIMQYNIIEKRSDIAIDQVTAIPELIMVINDNEFDALFFEDNEILSGKIHMINCADRKEAIALEKELNRYFSNKNIFEDQSNEDVYRVFTQNEAYQRVKQFAGVLQYVLSIFDILLVLSSIIMIHFKNTIEMDYDNIKNITLYKLGFDREERYNIFKKELGTIFIIPTSVAMVFTSIFVFSLLQLSDRGIAAVGILLILGGILLLFQKLFCVAYSKHYFCTIENNIEAM